MSSNSTGQSSSSIFDSSYFSKEAHIVLLTLYLLITLINFLANALVWTVILSKKQLRSPMNYLLLNLSLADMVSAVSIFPYLFILDTGTAAATPAGKGRVCAHTEGLGIFFIGSGASLLTLCAISFNRFLAIKHPTRQSLRMNRRSVLGFNIFSWIMSISCMVPNMISFKYESAYKTCLRDWGEINGLVYRILLMLIGLLFPVTFLLMSYCAILVKAREITPLEDSVMNGRRNIRMRKAERMLGLLILIYIICWSPFIIFWILGTTTDLFPTDQQGVDSSNRWLRVTVFFCCLNGTLDPFVYIIGSNDLKHETYRFLKILWLRITCRKTSRVHPLRRTFSYTLRLDKMIESRETGHRLSKVSVTKTTSLTSSLTSSLTYFNEVDATEGRKCEIIGQSNVQATGSIKQVAIGEADQPAIEETNDNTSVDDS